MPSQPFRTSSPPLLEVRWRRSIRGLTPYARLQFVGDSVVGEWLCLDAATGDERWRRRPSANMIVGVRHDVIIATVYSVSGMHSGGNGIYAYDLRSGELLWMRACSNDTLNRLWSLPLVHGLLKGFGNPPGGWCPEGVVSVSDEIFEWRSGRLVGRFEGEPPFLGWPRCRRHADGGLRCGDRRVDVCVDDSGFVLDANEPGRSLWRVRFEGARIALHAGRSSTIAPTIAVLVERPVSSGALHLFVLEAETGAMMAVGPVACSDVAKLTIHDVREASVLMTVDGEIRLFARRAPT